MDYTGIRKRANDLIQKNGKIATLTLTTDSAYDPVTGNTTSATATYYAYCVESQFDLSQRDGSLVKATDKRLIISGLQTNGSATPEITTQYKITVNGVTLEVVNALPTKPGDIPVVYEVQCRG